MNEKTRRSGISRRRLLTIAIPSLGVAIVAAVIVGYFVSFANDSKSQAGHAAGTQSSIDVSDAAVAPPALGIQFHGTWKDYYSGDSAKPNAMFFKQLDQLAAQRIKLIRVDIGWASSQPEPGTPNINSTYNQRVVRVLQEARNRNMKVLLTIWTSPGWARGNTGGANQFPNDPASVKPWATWMAKTFGDKVEAWQLWNEPNIKEFTNVRDDAERPTKYVPLLKSMFEGIRAGDSDAKTVFGATANNDDAFIRRCYELGAKDYFDVMAVHPYPGSSTEPPDVPDPGSKYSTNHFAAVAQVMREFGDSAKPVWWTEFGYSVHSNVNVPAEKNWFLGVDSEKQAGEYIKRAFELARKQYPQVKAIFVYTAYSTTDDEYGHQRGFSALNADGTARERLKILTDYIAQFPQHS